MANTEKPQIKTVKPTEDPIEAMEKGLPLMVPANAVVEFFRYAETSKGGQYKYIQERELPKAILEAAPYLKGTQKPALFNEYRGNPGIYLAGATMDARGFANPEKTLKRFALVLIPVE